MFKQYFSKIMFLLFILIFLVGCNSLFINQSNQLKEPTLPLVTSPFTEPTLPNPADLIDQDESHVGTITNGKWHLQLSGDFGVQKGMYTSLSNEKLTFIITFSLAVDQESVEEALQNNLIIDDLEVDTNSPQETIKIPNLKYSWLNPIQLEVVFPGDEAMEDVTYAITPNGSKDQFGEIVFEDEPGLQFQVTSNHNVFRIDQQGKVSRALQKIPQALEPIAQNKDGSKWILGRKTKVEAEGPTVPYLYNSKTQKIERILPERWEIPFWGYDNQLYTLTDKSLIQIEQNEEKWIEFAQYPYIHGWSQSPNMRYEVYFVSRDWQDEKTKVSIILRDSKNKTENIYDEVIQANSPDSQGKLSHYEPIWIPNQEKIYIPAIDLSAPDLIFDLETGEVEEAPNYLKASLPSYSPQWSANGKYISIFGKGVYAQDGELLINWQNNITEPINIPIFNPIWHPKLPILAFETYSSEGKAIVQINVETGEEVITVGDYHIFDWDRNQGGLLIIGE